MRPVHEVWELFVDLRETVVLLAAPPADQRAWLTERQYPVDEIALDLADIVPDWFPLLGSAALLDFDAEASLIVLDDALDRMCGRDLDALWTFDALFTAPEWEQVRVLARRALATLHPQDEPA
jgi:hypothetical protein